MPNKTDDFSPIPVTSMTSPDAVGYNVDATQQIPMEVHVRLGTSVQKVSQILKYGRGAVIELDRRVGDPVDIVINDKLVARGVLVKVGDDRVGVTLTEMVKEHLHGEV
jgi:flagellar motor switch protein FliN/FliY